MARNAVLLCIFVALIAFISTVYAGSSIPETLPNPLPYDSTKAIEYAIDLTMSEDLIAQDFVWNNDPLATDAWTPSRGHPFAMNVIAWVASLNQEFKGLDVLKIADKVFWEDIDTKHMRLSFVFIGEQGYNRFKQLYTYLDQMKASVLRDTLSRSVSPAAFRGIIFTELAYFNRYIPLTCFDGEKNGDETGVDCGGSLGPNNKDATYVCPRCAQGFGSLINPKSGYANMDPDDEYPPLNMGCKTDYDCLAFSKCVDTQDYVNSYDEATFKDDPDVAGLKICSYYSIENPPLHTTWSPLIQGKNSAASASIAFALVIALAAVFF